MSLSPSPPSPSHAHALPPPPPPPPPPPLSLVPPHPPPPLYLPSQHTVYHLVEKDENSYPLPASATNTPRHADIMKTGLDHNDNRRDHNQLEESPFSCPSSSSSPSGVKKPRRRGTRAGKNRRRAKINALLRAAAAAAAAGVNGSGEMNVNISSPTSIDLLEQESSHDDGDDYDDDYSNNNNNYRDDDSGSSTSGGDTPSHTQKQTPSNSNSLLPSPPLNNNDDNNNINKKKKQQRQAFHFGQRTPEAQTRTLPGIGESTNLVASSHRFSTPNAPNRSIQSRAHQGINFNSNVSSMDGSGGGTNMYGGGGRADADRDWRSHRSGSYPPATQQGFGMNLNMKSMYSHNQSRTAPSSPNRSSMNRRSSTATVQADSLAALKERLQQHEAFNNFQSNSGDNSTSPTRSLHSHSKLNADAPEFTPRSLARSLSDPLPSPPSSSGFNSSISTIAVPLQQQQQRSSSNNRAVSSNRPKSSSDKEGSSVLSSLFTDPAAGFIAVCAYILLASISLAVGSYLFIVIVGIIGFLVCSVRESLLSWASPSSLSPSHRSTSSSASSLQPHRGQRQDSSSRYSSVASSTLSSDGLSFLEANQHSSIGHSRIDSPTHTRVMNQLLGSQAAAAASNRRKSMPDNNSIGNNNNNNNSGMNPSSGVSSGDGITRYKPVFVPRSNPGSPQLGPARRISQQSPSQPQLTYNEPQPSVQVRGDDADSKFDEAKAVDFEATTPLKVHSNVQSKAQGPQAERVVAH